MEIRFPSCPTEFCVTDVGSTTTKAILFREEAGAWRFYRRESPTTVEKPHEDVMIGVTRALRLLEEASGARLLGQDRPAVPYLSTSSAGGGLAMVVTGLVRDVTSRSAERVALGAGAILLDVIAMDDGRTPYEKIEALRSLRPDMILLAGGFDGDAISGPVFLAELIRESGLRPKLSPTARLPVIYAGNVHARDYVKETLDDSFLFHIVPNIRPASEREDLEPARAAIHDLFMDHVMSQAPGYEGLRPWVDAPILPTPSAFAKILALASRELGTRILAIDIGGATTDVFTAERGKVFRTVSANLGMSYSILNVAQRAGIDAILELLDDGRAAETTSGAAAARISFTPLDLWDEIGEKYLHPTRLPQNARQREMERAAGTVAIREAVADHLQVLAGVSLNRGKEELHVSRAQPRAGTSKGPERRFALSGYDLVIGSGGLLSHSPRPLAARMLIDALRPRKPLEIAVDSAFMFPHLGAISDVAPELALRLFRELGLIRLGAHATGGPAARGDATTTTAFANEPIDQPAADSSLPPVPDHTTLRLKRELAIPGQVFVEPGASVEPETLIARSTRQFLRPFFLAVTESIGAAPRELPALMRKGVGEEVEAGELLAERRANLIVTKHYRTPVPGTIERVLPSGALVLREKAEDAEKLTVVQVARDLRLAPESIRPHVRVTEGQLIERDQVLASIQRSGGVPLTSRSPVRGRVREINHVYGVITLEPHLETLETRAWLPGVVESVSQRGAIVAGEGTLIEGRWGLGAEVSGHLCLGEPRPGAVLVRDTVSGEELRQLEPLAIAGLIAGSLHLSDALTHPPAYTLVLTEGFGDRPMRPELRDLLEPHAGGLTLLDGRTELRVGVRRPFAILAAT
jgi:uncharacterized protein (TIGR01319 family)